MTRGLTLLFAVAGGAAVAAGAGAHGARDLLAQRVSASLTAATVFLALALAVTLIARPRRPAAAAGTRPDALPGSENPADPGADATARRTVSA
jgi:hypothetical protein